MRRRCSEAVELRKSYGGREALKGVSLEAREGELIACIGPNGAGKTTLLTILANIQPADSGTMSTAGRVGWVPQQPAALQQAQRGREPAAVRAARPGRRRRGRCHADARRDGAGRARRRAGRPSVGWQPSARERRDRAAGLSLGAAAGRAEHGARPAPARAALAVHRRAGRAGYDRAVFDPRGHGGRAVCDQGDGARRRRAPVLGDAGRAPPDRVLRTATSKPRSCRSFASTGTDAIAAVAAAEGPAHPAALTAHDRGAGRVPGRGGVTDRVRVQPRLGQADRGGPRRGAAGRAAPDRQSAARRAARQGRAGPAGENGRCLLAGRGGAQGPRRRRARRLDHPGGHRPQGDVAARSVPDRAARERRGPGQGAARGRHDLEPRGRAEPPRLESAHQGEPPVPPAAVEGRDRERAGKRVHRPRAAPHRADHAHGEACAAAGLAGARAARSGDPLQHAGPGELRPGRPGPDRRERADQGSQAGAERRPGAAHELRRRARGGSLADVRDRAARLGVARARAHRERVLAAGAGAGLPHRPARGEGAAGGRGGARRDAPDGAWSSGCSWRSSGIASRSGWSR